jgi:hypothetical protein
MTEIRFTAENDTVRRKWILKLVAKPRFWVLQQTCDEYYPNAILDPKNANNTTKYFYRDTQPGYKQRVEIIDSSKNYILVLSRNAESYHFDDWSIQHRFIVFDDLSLALEGKDGTF